VHLVAPAGRQLEELITLLIFLGILGLIVWWTESVVAR
jgi:hypothetical protein